MGSHLIKAAAALAIGFAAPLGGASVVYAAGDCSAAARSVLAENPGGTLLSAEPNGKECVVIVLTASNGGEHPKRKVYHVPM